MRPAPARFPIIRRPPLRLVVTIVLALACGLVVARTTSTAEATIARHGATTTAWVVTEAMAPGHIVGPGGVSAQPRPVAFLPEGAVVDDPSGDVVRHALAPGEVVAEHHLVGGDRRGPAALVPDGWRALAVPPLDAVLPVEVGQYVDVLVAFAGGDASPFGSVVVEGGLVVDVADSGTVTVAVPAARAGPLVTAMASGFVALALAPGPSGS